MKQLQNSTEGMGLNRYDVIAYVIDETFCNRDKVRYDVIVCKLVCIPGKQQCYITTTLRNMFRPVSEHAHALG
jgi:hypothetical protein